MQTGKRILRRGTAVSTSAARITKTLNASDPGTELSFTK
jgi:hypothetical protein